MFTTWDLSQLYLKTQAQFERGNLSENENRKYDSLIFHVLTHKVSGLNNTTITTFLHNLPLSATVVRRTSA